MLLPIVNTILLIIVYSYCSTSLPVDNSLWINPCIWTVFCLAKFPVCGGAYRIIPLQLPVINISGDFDAFPFF